MIRIADHPVHALSGYPWDMIMALDGETERRHRPNLREGGIYLSREMTREIESEARSAFGSVVASNSVLVGLLLSVIGADSDRVANASGEERRDLLKRGRSFAERWNFEASLPFRREPARAAGWTETRRWRLAQSWGDASSWQATR